DAGRFSPPTVPTGVPSPGPPSCPHGPRPRQCSACHKTDPGPSATVKCPAEPQHRCRQCLSVGRQAILLRTSLPFPPAPGADAALLQPHCLLAYSTPPPRPAGNDGRP